MSVTIRPYRRGGWEVDIRVVTPDGTRQLRERKRAPVSSRSAAVRWAEGRERVLFERLDAAPRRTRTTEGGAHTTSVRAEIHRRPRAGESAEAERDRSEEGDPAACYLMPAFGRKRLDAIKSEDVQRLKAQLELEVAEDGQQHPRRC